jgi:hypothetical protein
LPILHLKKKRLLDRAAAKWSGCKGSALGRQPACRNFGYLRLWLSYLRSKHVGSSPLTEHNASEPSVIRIFD